MNHELNSFLSLRPGREADLKLAQGDAPVDAAAIPESPVVDLKRDPRNDLFTGEDGKEHWGFHMMVDCSGCNKNIDDGKQIKKFIKDLVAAIKMTAVGEPFLYNFGTDSDGGWSALQLITTSNISMHGDNRIGSMYFDIFSCKPYDQSVVLKMIDERFKPKFRKVNFLYRDAPHDDLTGKTNELTVGR